MALPKLNESIKYEMEIPSTGNIVTYRPYLVKEEKILLQAFEAQDQKLAMRAMVDTVIACVFEPVKSSELSTFDVEYMFTQIRSKSVGETAELKGKCTAEECDAQTDFTINLTEVQVTKSDASKIIELSDNISVELRYPTYDGFVENYKEGISETQFGMQMMEDCIVAVMTPDERIDVSEVPRSEVRDFIDGMTNKQFQLIGEFLNTAPKMTKDVEFICSECGHENKITLEGLQDFF